LDWDFWTDYGKGSSGKLINLLIPGQMTEGELLGIESLAISVPSRGCVVEVGSLYGLSSWAWAKSVDPSVTVYCLDPWKREQWIIDLVEVKFKNCPEFSFEAFQKYTADCTNIVPMRGYSPNDFLEWSRPVDLFFDDALHHNPFIRNSLRFWLKKMRPGGIMCGHDYCEEWSDVVAEVSDLAAELGVSVGCRERLWWFEVPSNPVRRLSQLWKWWT
jgi:hypothetical protein